MSATPQPAQDLTIRLVPFTDEYTDQIVAGCREMWKEAIDYSTLKVDETKLIAQLKNARTNPNLYLKLAVSGTEAVGGLFGTMSTIFYSGERCARDLGWFVKKEARFGRAALLLVSDWEAWGKSKGAKLFMLGQSTGINPEITRKLYERIGYKVVGVNTMKMIP